MYIRKEVKCHSVALCQWMNNASEANTIHIEFEHSGNWGYDRPATVPKARTTIASNAEPLLLGPVPFILPRIVGLKVEGFFHFASLQIALCCIPQSSLLYLKTPYTVECRYNAVQYCKILHK